MKRKIKNICFDIDGIICTVNKSNNYKKSKPRKKYKFINNLYNSGYTITLHTARYMGRYKNNRKIAEKK